MIAFITQSKQANLINVMLKYRFLVHPNLINPKLNKYLNGHFSKVSFLPSCVKNTKMQFVAPFQQVFSAARNSSGYVRITLATLDS